MKEAFRIAEENTKKRKSADKRQRDLTATLRPLEVGGRVLVRNLTERVGPGKIRSFWEQQIYRIYRIKEKKDKDGLMYSVVEEATQKAESESFTEITFYHVNNFQHLPRKKTTENSNSNNSKNSSNLAIRKQLKLGTAVMAVT